MFAIMRRTAPTSVPMTAKTSASTDGRTEAGTRLAADGPVVWYVLDGAEFREEIPPGQDMWTHVATVVGRARSCAARADDPPSYDTGTRNWTLMLRMESGRRGRTEELAVPVRWQSGAS